jgi:hypothetical protein
LLADAHVRAAAQSPADAEALRVAVILETATDVAGFAKSTSRAPLGKHPAKAAMG